MKTTNAGQIALYVPAPNPPVLNGDPAAMLASLSNFDLTSIRRPELYAISEGFLGGFLKGRLLGVDIGDAVIEAVPPGNGGDAFFRGQASIANDPRNWVKLFVDDALLNFEIRQSPTQSIEKTFTSWKTQLGKLVDKGENITAADIDAQFLPFLDALYSQLPKAKLEARLENIHLPPELQTFLQVAPNASLALEAFSPRFEPTLAGDSPSAFARRNGGIVMKGSFTFGGLVTVPNAELAVLPKPYDPLATTVPPDLAGEFRIDSATLAGGVQMRNALLSFNSAVPSFKLNGAVTAIDLPPLMRIEPLNNAAELGATVNFRGSATPSALFRIEPAKLIVPLIAGNRTVVVHGASVNDAFSFSTSEPWTANASIQDTLPFELKAGNDVLISLTRENVSGISLQRDASGVVTFAITNRPGSQITVFPTKSIQQTFRFSQQTTLVVRTDGTFSMTGSLQENASVATSVGLLIGGVGSGGSVTFERVRNAADATFDTRLILQGNVSGGVLPAGTIATDGRVTLSLANGASVSGSVSLPPLDFVRFRLAPPAGTANFSASLSRSGLVLATGTARLLYDSVEVCQFPLSTTGTQIVLPPATNEGALGRLATHAIAPSFTLPGAAGDFSFSVTTSTFNLFNFPLGQTSFTFGRRSGVVTVTVNGSQLALPLAGIPTINLGGTLNSDGLFALTNRAAISSFNPAGSTLPIRAMANASAVLKRELLNSVRTTSLALTGNVSAGVLDTVTPVGTASGSLTARLSGPGATTVPTLTLAGEIRLRPLRVPAADPAVFLLESVTGPDIVATLNNSSLTLSGIRFSAPGLFNETFTLQPLILPASGSFTQQIGPVTLSLPVPNAAAYNLATVQFQVDRTAGIWSLKNFSGDVTLPGFATVKPRLSGTISSDGTFDLTSAATVTLPLTGQPVDTFASGTARLKRERSGSAYSLSLRVDGTLGGGILQQIGVPTAQGSAQFSSTAFNGIGGPVTVTKLDFGALDLVPDTGNSFSATLGSSGLTFNTGSARLQLNDNTLCTFPLNTTGTQFTIPPSAEADQPRRTGLLGLLPSFLMPRTGDFEFAVNPPSFTILGFNLGAPGFKFGRRQGVVGVWDFGGNLPFDAFRVSSVVGSPLATRLGGTINASSGVIAFDYFAATGQVPTSRLRIGGIEVGNGEIHLSNSGLSAKGNISPTGSGVAFGLNGVVDASGGYSLTGTLTSPLYGFPMQSAKCSLSGAGSGSGSLKAEVSFSFTGLNSTLNNATLQGDIRSDGFMDLSLVSPTTLTVAGWQLSNPVFHWSRPAGLNAIPTLEAGGSLIISGNSYLLGGTITVSGTQALPTLGFGPASLTLGGFSTSNGRLTLDNTGLNASGTFTIRALGTSFGDIGFAGRISRSVRNNFIIYSLARTSGDLKIGGVSISNPDLSLSSGGSVLGSATLPFGAISASLNNLSISPGAGLSFDQYDRAVDSGWKKLPDPLPTELGDVSVRLAGKVAFRPSGGTSFSATLEYSWATWTTYETCEDTDNSPFTPPVCTTHRPPNNIDSVSMPPRFSDSSGIGTNGEFKINNFNFDLW